MDTAQLLEFERTRPRHNGPKDLAIRRTFGVSSTRYYQALARAVRTREALEVDAITARRVQRRLVA